MGERRRPARRFSTWLGRRWLLVPIAAVAGVVIAIMLSLLPTPTYSTSADIFVGLTERPGDDDPFAASQFVLQRMQSYAQLATSSQVMNAVIKQVGLTPGYDLSNHVTATAPPGGVLIDIDVTNTNGRDAANIADAAAAQLGQAITGLEAPPELGQSPIRAIVVAPALVPTKPTGLGVLASSGVGLLAGLLVGMGALSALSSSQRVSTTVPPPDGGARAEDAPVGDWRVTGVDGPAADPARSPTTSPGANTR